MARSSEYEAWALHFDAMFFSKQAPRQVLLSIQALIRDGLIPIHEAVEQHVMNLYAQDEEYAKSVTEYMNKIRDVKDELNDVTFNSEWKETYCTYAISQYLSEMGRKAELNKQREGGYMIGGIMADLKDKITHLEHTVGTGISSTRAGNQLFNELVNDKAADVICPFGVKLLDDATGGIRQGDMIMVSAKTGGGKTSMMIHISANAVLSGQNVLYLAYEGRKKDIWTDYLYYFTDKKALDIAFNQKDAALVEKLYQEGRVRAEDEYGRPGAFHSMMLHTSEEAGLTGDLRVDLSNIRQIIMDEKISIIVVDHVDKLGERTSNASTQGSNGYRKYKQIVTKLLGFANHYQVTMVVGKQSNGWRQSKENPTELHHTDGLADLTDDKQCASPATIAFSINTSVYEQKVGMARIGVFKARSAAPPPPFVIRTGKDVGIYCGGCVLPDGNLVYDPISSFYVDGRISGVGAGGSEITAFYTEMEEKRGYRYPSVPKYLTTQSPKKNTKDPDEVPF